MPTPPQCPSQSPLNLRFCLSPLLTKLKRRATKKSANRRGLRERVVQSRDLLAHLDARRKEALEADEQDRVNMLEEHGLLLKVEIPRGPSHLDLDAGSLDGVGEFGSNLILASELFRQIDRANAARSGSTMSPEAMERAMKSADVPHYMG